MLVALSTSFQKAFFSMKLFSVPEDAITVEFNNGTCRNEFLNIYCNNFLFNIYVGHSQEFFY
jgi:hypothetical protein